MFTFMSNVWWIDPNCMDAILIDKIVFLAGGILVKNIEQRLIHALFQFQRH